MSTSTSLSRRRSTQNAKPSLLTRTLTHTQTKKIPFLYEKEIAAGNYKATITDVSEATTKNGEEAIDIVYELISDDGKQLVAKERLTWDGFAFERLINHLFDSGLLAFGATIQDAVGICEAVTVEYTRKGSLGNIKNRQPWPELDEFAQKKVPRKSSSKVPASKVDDAEADLDDDFDDFFDDDGDDD